jgi:hypothetical protein
LKPPPALSTWTLLGRHAAIVARLIALYLTAATVRRSGNCRATAPGGSLLMSSGGSFLVSAEAYR